MTIKKYIQIYDNLDNLIISNNNSILMMKLKFIRKNNDIHLLLYKILYEIPKKQLNYKYQKDAAYKDRKQYAKLYTKKNR